VRAAAIVLSYGRRELGELLTMWSMQSRLVPLLVWLDDCAAHVDARGCNVVLHHASAIGGGNTIGGVRRAAVALARQLFGLGPLDAFIVLDDDDFYSRHHAARTLEALEAGAEWTGAKRMGIQWHPDQMPPELVTSTSGPGQHAAWAMRLSAYDRAGGYREEDRLEDVRLAERIQWDVCRPHPYLTHVRRQFGFGSMTSVEYDRVSLRSGELPALIEPTWRPELVQLERWALAHERAESVSS
jgi:hypothetical protein